MTDLMTEKEFDDKNKKLKKKEPEKKPEKKPKKINITFRENRKFDLHINRNMITFRGRETKLVNVDWLLHDDFRQVERLFIIEKE